MAFASRLFLFVHALSSVVAPAAGEYSGKCPTILTAKGPVVLSIRELASGGGPYVNRTLSFPDARYVEAPMGGPPVIGIPGRSGAVYDTSAGVRALESADAYEGDGPTYGASDAQLAIRRYLPRKDFQDGILDIFLAVRTADPDPMADVLHAYAIVNNFGSLRETAGRHGPRGMRHNPDPGVRRHVRLFVIETGPRPRGGQVPAQVVQIAAEIARDFGTDVAVSDQYVQVAPDGRVFTDGSWILFSPRFRPR